jgi:hypothetical protein
MVADGADPAYSYDRPASAGAFSPGAAPLAQQCDNIFER